MVQGLRPSQLCSDSPQVLPAKRLVEARGESSPLMQRFQTGLLVITLPIRQILQNVTALLREAHQLVDQTLYVCLEPGYQGPVERAAFTPEEISQLRMIIPRIYAEAARECSNLDVRILQGCLKNVELLGGLLDKKVDVVIAHQEFEHEWQYTRDRFVDIPKVHKVTVPMVSSEVDFPEISLDSVSFESVCLGGTFDRLHLGHKMLLSAAVARATERLVVGVTDGDMITSKVLWELIEPLEERMQALERCLRDMDPTLHYEISPIYDPYGPTLSDSTLQCLYVSDETIGGGVKVNEERVKKNFPPMALFNVSLLPNHNKLEEFMDDKISSSSNRIALLGKILRPPEPNPDIPKSPLVIGLTGGVCSGKKHMLKTLEALGAVCISVDSLGQETCTPGPTLNHGLVDEYGSKAWSDDGTIHRKVLDEMIVTDAGRRGRLNELPWLEIGKQLRQKVEEAAHSGASTVIIESALLFEGGLDRLAHMVWYSIIPEREAVSRVIERDCCSQEVALQKVHSQKPAKALINRAHVVLSSMWEEEVTQNLVRRTLLEAQRYYQ